MARTGAAVEIARRDAPDLGQLLRERAPAPHHRPLSRRSHGRDAPLLERRRRSALARKTQRPISRTVTPDIPRNPPGSVTSNWQTGDIFIGRLHGNAA